MRTLFNSVSMRCSLLALAFTLAACDRQPNDPQPSDIGASTRQSGWNKETTQQLRGAIKNRAKHGLDRLSFNVDGELGSSEGQNKLTETALKYAAALAGGASDPSKLNTIYTITQPKVDLESGLTDALKTGKLAEWLDSLAPQDDNYRKLSEAYLAMRKQDDAPSAVIPETAKPLEPGASDQRITAIARQLVASDYLDSAAVQGDRYSAAMVKAVKRMQVDYGIESDGVIGSEALEILNLSDADRARAIAVAMERMRWIPRDAPATRIDVNLASARLTYWREGKISDTRKVIVGKPDTETPQLGSPIYRLVANPTWTVPRSIQNKDFKGKGNAYLRRNNMVWKDGWIVQEPGPKNSLGLVKFDMKNDHQIYLHDTPAKQLFREAQRQRSHGCVRVDDALGFAELLARDEGVLGEWQKARSSGKESFISLPKEIPVTLYYQTVLFDETGEPVIRADPYGWNDRVSTALGFPASEVYRLRSAASDVGP